MVTLGMVNHASFYFSMLINTTGLSIKDVMLGRMGGGCQVCMTNDDQGCIKKDDKGDEGGGRKCHLWTTPNSLTLWTSGNGPLV